MVDHSTPLNELELSPRVIHLADGVGLRTIGDVVALQESELLSLPNYGRKSFDEIRGLFHYLGVFPEHWAPMEKQTPAKPRVGDGTPGPGRPKGIPNKTTTQLKEAILEAAEKAGGEGKLVGYLQAQAVANPTAFMSLLGKVLPMTVANADPAGFRFIVETGVPRAGEG